MYADYQVIMHWAWIAVANAVIMIAPGCSMKCGNGDTYRHEILHDGTCRSLFGGGGGTSKGTPKSKIFGLNFDNLTADISKTVSRVRELHVISSMTAF